MITFKKYHCLGRDFILLDNRDGAFDSLRNTDLARLCERRFGIGASGILRVDAISKGSVTVAAYSFNGVLAELNAADAACVAAFAKSEGASNVSINISINEQTVRCKVASNHEGMTFVNVRVVEPVAIKKVFQNFVMELGATFYMVPTDDVSSVDVLEKGRALSRNKRFPKGANIVFYQPNLSHLDIRHYEYQIDEEPYTNGLCVIGAALSHAQNSPSSSCFVRTKSGEVQVTFTRAQQTFHNVELQLLVNAVYDGTTN